MRRTLTLSMMLGLLLALSATPALATHANENAADNAADHRPNAVYANDQLWDTLILRDLPVHEENRHSFDLLYRFPDGPPNQKSVAEYAPGEVGYNGGRWIEVFTEWVGSEQPLLTSAADVRKALDNGLLRITGEGRAFECPLF
jgi:hypothetical protein